MIIIILIVIFNFPDDQLISFKSGAMPQAPLVPNSKAEPKRHAPRVRWGVSTQRQEPKHHLCAGKCQPKSRARAPLVRWECQTQMQEPKRHMDTGFVPSPQAGAKRHVSPRGFSLIVITIY